MRTGTFSRIPTGYLMERSANCTVENGIQTASAQFYRVVLKDIDPTGTYESIYRYLRLLRKAKADDTLIVRGKS